MVEQKEKFNLSKLLIFFEEKEGFKCNRKMCKCPVHILREFIKILTKHKYFSGRAKIAKEFDKWCEENNAQNCSLNCVAWMLGRKNKEIKELAGKELSK